MQHLAIMNSKLGLIPDILSGRKKIESRWYKHKRAPWNKIVKGELIYFKNSGGAVEARAEVERVIQYELNEEVIKRIIDDYGGEGGINLNNKEPKSEFYKKKNYCILIFLREAKRISKFDINKEGFGSGAAWICVEDIEKIRKNKEKEYKP